jgi:glyoxylase-like metal-dependent hydrolase (beta-lactamase superfamily II)/rhodanese-related sulfurtransferase
MSISPAELYARLRRKEPTLLVDVRMPADYARWQIEGSLNAPQLRLPDPTQVAAEVERGAVGPIPKAPLVVTICGRGITSAPVAEGLRLLGYDAASLADGMRGWGDHYEVLPVVEGAPTILQVARPARGCLSWVLISEGEAVVVDALRHVDRYLEILEARDLRLVAAVDTHAHADHVSGGRALAEAAGASYYLHPYDAIHPIDLVPAAFPYEPLLERRTFAFGDSMMDVLHVPGHTLGACGLLVDDRYLVAGDTLFIGGIARPDLGGRAESWTPLHQASLRRLLALDTEVLVLPGHFAAFSEADAEGRFASTIGSIRENNVGARLAASEPERFSEYVLSSLPAFPPGYVDIKRVNLGLQVGDEARASELELGKNVCALTATPGSPAGS